MGIPVSGTFKKALAILSARSYANFLMSICTRGRAEIHAFVFIWRPISLDIYL